MDDVTLATQRGDKGLIFCYLLLYHLLNCIETILELHGDIDHDDDPGRLIPDDNVKT